MLVLLYNIEIETYVSLFEHTVNICKQYQLTLTSNKLFIDFEITKHTTVLNQSNCFGNLSVVRIHIKKLFNE